MTWLAVAAGGALGSMARHWVNLEIAHRWDTFTLGHGGEHVLAATNLLAQNAIGLAVLWVGYYVALRFR